MTRISATSAESAPLPQHWRASAVGARPRIQFGVAAPRLLTAGDAFEDLVFVGLDGLPALGEEVKTDTFHATIGGGAVIAAVAASRLGVPTAILSALSRAAATRLRRERVRVHNLRQGREPHAITAALSTATDRAFVTYNGVNAVLEPRLLDALPTTAADHVHLALTPRDLTAWIRCVKRLKRAGRTVSFDFGWSRVAVAARRSAGADGRRRPGVRQRARGAALRPHRRASTTPTRFCAGASARSSSSWGRWAAAGCAPAPRATW